MSKTYVVTGVRGTIGSAIAKRLLDDGYSVIGTYFRPGFPYDDNITLRYLNLRDYDSILAFVVSVANEFGFVDGLVNCAGINHPASFDAVTEGELRDVMSVNATGTFLLTRELLPYIRDGGVIVNIGSLSAYVGGPRSVHYAMSKATLSAMTVGVAKFAAKRGITCNLVAPGYLESKMTDNGIASVTIANYVDSIPLGRLGKAEEVADAVAYLLQARYVTGATIHVNGGLYFS